jgi:hypothetical protein
VLSSLGRTGSRRHAHAPREERAPSLCTRCAKPESHDFFSAVALQVLNVYDWDVNRAVIVSLKGDKPKNDQIGGVTGWAKDLNNFGAYALAMGMQLLLHNENTEELKLVQTTYLKSEHGKGAVVLDTGRVKNMALLTAIALVPDVSKSFDKNVIKENATCAVGLIAYVQKTSITNIYKVLAGVKAKNMSSTHPVHQALGRETSDEFIAELVASEFGQHLQRLILAEFTKRGEPEKAFVTIRCACEQVHTVIKSALEKKHGIFTVEDELAASTGAPSDTSTGAPSNTAPASSTGALSGAATSTGSAIVPFGDGGEASSFDFAFDHGGDGGLFGVNHNGMEALDLEEALRLLGGPTPGGPRPARWCSRGGTPMVLLSASASAQPRGGSARPGSAPTPGAPHSAELLRSIERAAYRGAAQGMADGAGMVLDAAERGAARGAAEDGPATNLSAQLERVTEELAEVKSAVDAGTWWHLHRHHRHRRRHLHRHHRHRRWHLHRHHRHRRSQSGGQGDGDGPPQEAR